MAAHQFTDGGGNAWGITVTLNAARRLRDSGYNLVNLQTAGEVVSGIFVDDVTLCEVLYAIVSPDAMAKGISEEKFLDLMTGHTEAAREALIAALPGFFGGQMKSAITRILAEMQAKLEEGMESLSTGESLTDTSESSVSTAADSLSGNSSTPTSE